MSYMLESLQNWPPPMFRTVVRWYYRAAHGAYVRSSWSFVQKW